MTPEPTSAIRSTAATADGHRRGSAPPAERARTSPLSRERAAEMLRLLGTTGHQVTTNLIERLPEPELAVTSTILLLSELADRGPLRPRDLMPVTGVTSGGMTRQLDRLEILGLVERRFGAIEGDRRATRVSLTAAGYGAMATMSAVLDEHAAALRDLAVAIRDLLPSEADAPGLPDGLHLLRYLGGLRRLLALRRRLHLRTDQLPRRLSTTEWSLPPHRSRSERRLGPLRLEGKRPPVGRTSSLRPCADR